MTKKKQYRRYSPEADIFHCDFCGIGCLLSAAISTLKYERLLSGGKVRHQLGRLRFYP